MESFNKIYNQDEDEELPKARYPKKLEPNNRYEICERLAEILNRPVGYILGRTKGIPERWLFEQWSYLKLNGRNKQKEIMWWLKNVNPK